MALRTTSPPRGEAVGGITAAATKPEYTGYRNTTASVKWNNELAGWRAQFSNKPAMREHLRQWQQRLTRLSKDAMRLGDHVDVNRR
ncbi:hypothetical protein ACNKHW_02155 [Shigella flexneri]